MSDAPRHPALEALDVVVGDWTIELTHPSFDAPVQGEAVFEWLEGERFLVQRSSNEHPDAPDSIAVIGVMENGELAMHYFDSRGVQRVYGVAVDGDEWRMWRDAPGFGQRFSGTIGAAEIAGQWQLCRDDETWADDLRITYRRSS